MSCVVFLIYKSLVRVVKSNVVVHTTASSVNLLVRCAQVWLYLKSLSSRTIAFLSSDSHRVRIAGNGCEAVLFCSLDIVESRSSEY